MDLAVRDHRLTERVGAFALAILALLVVLQVALGDCAWRDGVRVTVYFEHLGGLREGGDMQVAGRVIGTIENISAVSARQARPGHPLHPGGGVAVSVRIADRYRHMTALNGEVFISTKGTFGRKYLEMGAPGDGEARARPLVEGDELRGVDPPHLDRVLMRSWRNLQLARSFLDDIRPEWNELMTSLEQLGGTLQSFDAVPAAVVVGDSMRQVAARARALAATLSEGGATPADIARLSERFQDTAERLDRDMALLRTRAAALMDDLERVRAALPEGMFARVGSALANMDASLVKARRIVDNARELGAMIRGGQGTIGALWNDPEFPEHAKGLGRLIKKHPWRLIGREPVE